MTDSAHFARPFDPPSGDGTREGWAAAVDAAARAPRTQEIVAKAHQGGKMVEAVLRTAEPSLRVRLDTAYTGNSARTEPNGHLSGSWPRPPPRPYAVCPSSGPNSSA